jgi:signal transduction histidine kinase
LPVGREVGLNISVLGQDDLDIGIRIRRTVTSSNDEAAACDAEFGPGKIHCGGEFLYENPSQEKRVNDLIFFINKEYIIKEKEDLIKLNMELEKKVDERTSQLRNKDIQLLEMDRIAGVATMAAGIAHEINNPLSFVKSSISFVQKGQGKMIAALKYWDDKPVSESLLKEFQEYLTQINFDYLISTIDGKFERIKNGIERIMNIVKNLKSFSMVDREEIGKINLNKNLEETMEVLSSADIGNVKFVTEFQELPIMECYVNDINQCLYHVIQNAVNAVENNGIVRITTSYDDKDEQIIVNIVDNGRGMTPAVLRQAFNPFFTTRPVGSGTGLGLTIVERIIKHHKGKVDISSTVDVGTTVTIKLPVARVPAKKQE